VKKWLILTVCAALVVAALLVWFGVEDARQAALLDGRIEEAAARVRRLEGREPELLIGGAPVEDVMTAHIEEVKARAELQTLRQEQERRRQP
jgi:hypothetical protein